jgi:hypothetical protein
VAASSPKRHWHLPPQPMATRMVHAPTSDTWHLPPPPVAADTVHVSLGELAATVQVVFFVNFIRRWSFLPKIRNLHAQSNSYLYLWNFWVEKCLVAFTS